MTISYCIPAHKRTDDLLASLPSVIAAANASPPIQIVIVDYGNPAPLDPQIRHLTPTLTFGVTAVIVDYRNRDYYHMAHARNLSIRAAVGEYVTIGATDIHLHTNFFQTIRAQIAKNPVSYFRSMTSGYIGVVTVNRKLLVDIGGYDERFEFYGKEDRDLLNRLQRRTSYMGYYDLDAILTLQRTPRAEKIRNYRLPLTLAQMSQMNKDILDENDRNNVVTVNQGKEWGQL